jgi:dihydroorotate dehydrogenase (NAD+) catalytic subunit
MTGADALEFLVAGASAVEIGTASFLDPRAPARIVSEIRDYCRRHDIASVASLTGSLNT